MKFKTIPQKPTTIEAQLFETADIEAAYSFLESAGVKAEVEETWLPGPGRGVTKGLKIRTIFSRNSRTLRAPIPLWIGVHPTGWVELYSVEDFARKFQSCE